MTKEELLASNAVGRQTPTSCQQTAVWEAIAGFLIGFTSLYCLFPIDMNNSKEFQYRHVSISIYKELNAKERYGCLLGVMYPIIYGNVRKCIDMGHVYYLGFLVVWR